MAEIERIDPISQSEFQRRYIDPGRPVIIRGALAQWPALGSWTPEYLAQKVGHRVVPVRSMRDGDYANSTSRDMTVRDYLSNIGAIGAIGAAGPAGGSDRDTKSYLSELRLQQYLPELLADVEMPALFPREQPLASVLYVGEGLFSQLHYHPFGSATLCLLYGHKRVRLYAPDQTRYLYKYGAHTANRNMSRTTCKRPDPTEFPDFAQAECLEVDVQAGELLFIPIYYWHSIENRELNIATVFFWRRNLRSRFLPPAGLRADYLHDVARALPAMPRRVLGNFARRTGLSKSGR